MFTGKIHMKIKIILSALLLLTFNNSMPVENIDSNTLNDMRWIDLTPEQQRLVKNSYKNSPLNTLIIACQ